MQAHRQAEGVVPSAQFTIEQAAGERIYPRLKPLPPFVTVRFRVAKITVGLICESHRWWSLTFAIRSRSRSALRPCERQAR
jgi:hypothetical protein